VLDPERGIYESWTSNLLDIDPQVNQSINQLITALDRDLPGGRAVWNFNVLAHDEVNGYRSSLTGYAEVRVIPRDIITCTT